MNKILPKQTGIVLLALVFVCMTLNVGRSQTVDYNSMSKEELQKTIAALELGLGAYTVGKELTKGQKEIASKNNDYKAYPGTMKFKDGDIFVIIDKKSNVVIATYERNKMAAKDDFKAMVGSLMLQYGEPTTEAHGKTIYWNFGSDGLISEELYRTAKGDGMLDKLTVLATVKFSSTQNVDTLSTSMAPQREQDSEESEVTSDNYVMIQSDILTKKYMGQ